jgi:hypothetical protein
MTKQSPIVSEFATPAEAAAYERWLREKVDASLAEADSGIPHDEVMASVQAIIDEAKVRQTKSTCSGSRRRVGTLKPLFDTSPT